MAIVMTINWMFGKNYGFLNGLPEVRTFFDYMGRWPYYLITLQAVAFFLYFKTLACSENSAVKHAGKPELSNASRVVFSEPDARRVPQDGDFR